MSELFEQTHILAYRRDVHREIVYYMNGSLTNICALENASRISLNHPLKSIFDGFARKRLPVRENNTGPEKESPWYCRGAPSS